MSDTLRDAVQKKYAKAIKARKGCCGGGGSESSCCGTSSKATRKITGNLYSEAQVEGLPTDMIATSFGCGNPTALAELYPGETVLDLGSGAGLDVLLSAKRVGPYGKAYGLDMTDEMLEEARRNQQKSEISNVEFLKGHIEDIPLPDNSVDVIISNCVINLSGDKDKVIKECFRVLKPGGRFAVSDIVLKKSIPQKLRQDLTAWAGCIAGALGETEYQGKLTAAGFENVEVQVTRIYDFTDLDAELFTLLSKDELAELKGAVVSSFIRAHKPVTACNGVDFSMREATTNDLAQVKQLLFSAGLPTVGVEANILHFLLAVNKANEPLAVIGMERSDSYGLLRSLVVTSASRKQGIGRALITAILSKAQSNGVKEVYLMTETAEKYLQRFGFVRVSRSEIPEPLLNKSALNSACSCRSTCMRLELNYR